MDKIISEKCYELWKKNDFLEAGKLIYESISNDKRPFWASNIFAECLKLTQPIPEFLLVLRTAKSPVEWRNAHKVFYSIRELTLIDEKKGLKDNVFSGILYLAENTAKVIYNAYTAEFPIDYPFIEIPAPFDEDSGWWIISNLKYIAEQVKDSNFEKIILKIAFEFEINE